MNTQQPESLRLAHIFDHPIPPDWSDMVAAVRELRRLHAENAALQKGYDAAVDALKDMAAEFRALDLPYGSKAYAKAIAVIYSHPQVAAPDTPPQALQKFQAIDIINTEEELEGHVADRMQGLQQGYDAARLEIDHLRGVTHSKLLAQPVAWMVYLPSIDTQHLYYSQEDMGYVDDVTNHDDAEVTPLYEMAAPKAEVAPAGEYPAGAIANGRTHIDRLESHYRFDCEAGPLSNCGDWHGLKRCFEHLADCASRGQAPAPAAVAGLSEAVNIQRRAFIRGWDERGMAHQLKGTEESDRRMKELADIYFPRAAPTQAAPVAQGDAEQRQMDAKHAAIYRWMLSNVPDAWNIINNWCLDAEAGTDDMHDALAARGQAKKGA